MLPTFVIGLREGLEASLIVGIVAAFLRQQGRTDALRWVWAGVGIAVAICVAVGVALDLVSRQLPQAEQEGLETIVGAIAVVAVTFMIFWMRRHARGLTGVLEHDAASALAQGSVLALVGMAFFAVIREGFETAVFLLAAFDASTNAAAAGAGAALGIVTAVAVGYGIYRGGVRIDLARFFRVTGLVLVLVAAGLVASRRAHRPRGRLAQRPAGRGGRPSLARRAGKRALGAPDRHARPAAAPDRRRGSRVPALRRADARVRPVARLAAAARRPAVRRSGTAAGRAGVVKAVAQLGALAVARCGRRRLRGQVRPAVPDRFGVLPHRRRRASPTPAAIPPS